jgi:hypothetical protein
LRRAVAELPARLQLPLARQIAKQRVAIMERFFEAVSLEAANAGLRP